MATIKTAAEEKGRVPELKGSHFLNARSFVTNAVFNLGGEFIIICLGAVSVPYVVKRLGTDRFGILSLVWVVVSSIGIFDLGLSRATTKFAAEARGRGTRHELPTLLGTSLTLQLALGLIGGSIVFLLSPWAAGTVLKIHGPSLSDAVQSFRILGMAVPVILATNCTRGILEALQRFDLVNYVKVPASASMFLSPLLVLPFGGGLPSVILLMMGFRFAAFLAYFGFCVSLLPRPYVRVSVEPKVLNRLLSYGGWVAISNITGPILIYLDRFMIGILLSVNAVAYYTAPADMVNRLLIVPASLCTILFPAFSSMEAAGDKGKLEYLFARSMKYLIIVLGPVLLFVAVFSRDILHLWLGPAFARESTLPLQILAVSVFINCLGFFPYSLLQGLGKPNLTGTFHLVELPLHALLMWILVTRAGIVGAAIASAVRILVDTVLLFVCCNFLGFTSPGMARHQRLTRSLVALAGFGAAIWICNSIPVSPLVRTSLAAVLLICYVVIQWRWSCDQRDRRFWAELVREFLVHRGRDAVRAKIVDPSAEM
jgi:O-antigen/teichoic acid export membrane protein